MDADDSLLELPTLATLKREFLEDFDALRTVNDAARIEFRKPRNGFGLHFGVEIRYLGGITYQSERRSDLCTRSSNQVRACPSGQEPLGTSETPRRIDLQTVKEAAQIEQARQRQGKSYIRGAVSAPFS